MPTKDLDRIEDDKFKPKPRPVTPGPPPHKPRKSGALPWLGALGLIAVVAAAVLAWRSTHHNPSPIPKVAASSSAAPRSTELLRIYGSNTMGEQLMPELVKEFMTKHDHYAGVAVEPSDRPNVTYVTGQRRDGAGRVEIVATGSETGFPALASGRADISMSSEPINAAQLQATKKLGNLSKPAAEHVIGIDGVAVIVHPSNSVTDLTLQQLEAIFSGRFKDWSDVGGKKGAIKLYVRGDDSGTSAIFKAAVLHGRSPCCDATPIPSSSDLSNAVARDTQGIGFIGTPYVSTNKALGLSEQGVEPRLPAPCTLKTEEYVLTRRLYLYTSETMKREVQDFIRFATSKEAWPIVQKAGFVDLDPSPSAACDPGHAKHTPDYLKATKGAQRLLTNFNFRPGSLDLDSKCYLSIAYLTDLLSSGAYGGHNRLLLIGYSDTAPPAKSHKQLSNQQLSQARADAVRKELENHLHKAGVNVQFEQPLGLGEQDPLAPNGTEEGRERNRRVEVWLR